MQLLLPSLIGRHKTTKTIYASCHAIQGGKKSRAIAALSPWLAITIKNINFCYCTNQGAKESTAFLTAFNLLKTLLSKQSYISMLPIVA